jgi:short-subunit dehydrogenase
VTFDSAAVVVTGGSGGIGRAVAVAALERGARVGLVARGSAGLDRAAAELGPRVATATADVTDRAAVDVALSQLRDELGPIDVLVNSAGLGAVGPATLSTTPAVTDQLLAANLTGVLHPTLAVLPSMLARRQGHVVVIGSVAGRIGVPGEAAYSASKFALNGFAEALALELRSWGIGVSLVSPGAVDTGFFAARGAPYARRWPPPIQPERVARAVIRAVERKRFDVVVPAWLRVALVARAAFPGAYSWAASRATGSATAGS